MKNLALCIGALLLLVTNILAQNPVGFYGYGGSGTWANHISVTPDGTRLVMAGCNNSQPHFLEVNTSGGVVTDRQVGNDYGEMFSSIIENSGDIYVGGIGGYIGSEKKYIVKYTAAMTQAFAKDYGSGHIRYLIEDGGNVAATGFSITGPLGSVVIGKPCILKLDANGNIIWYKEYHIGTAKADAYSIHEHGGNYYVVGSIDEGGNARSYILSVKAVDGSVNWIKTYASTNFSPHFTGMSVSSTGIIACGTTSSLGDGNLMVAKVDFTGNLLWTRQINDAYSWYSRSISSGYSWGINCAVDPYGSVVVAYEDKNAGNNHGGLLAKLDEATGAVTWIKKYKTSNGDGFHGITIFECTYLASGWFHSNTYNYGLVVSDQDGFVGPGANPTTVTRTNSTPNLIVVNETGNTTATTLNTVTNYAHATNTIKGLTKTTKQTGTSTICNILNPDSCEAGNISGSNKVCVGDTIHLYSTGDSGGTWASSNTGAATINAATGIVTGVAAGTTVIKYKIVNGTCSDSATYNVTVNPVFQNNVTASICGSSTYTRPSGIVVSAPGIYIDTLQSATGCDSIITTNLTTGQRPSIYINRISDPPCDTSQLNWATWTNVTSNTATGQISSTINVTVNQSSGSLSTTAGMYSGNVFPPQYSVPINSTAIRNDLAGIFTICFSQPVTNPQVAIASIGSSTNNITVQITTSVPYQIIWAGQGVTYQNDTTFTGTEGYTIVRFPGTHTCISFNYHQSENYCNLAFGIQDINCQSIHTLTKCAGAPADTLRANGAVNYTWSPAVGLNTTNGAVVIATPSSTTTYRVTGYDANNCSNIDSVTIVVIPASTSTIYDSICPHQSYTLPSGRIVNSGGVYNDTLQTSNNCDSIVIFHLFEYPAYQKNINASICSGGSYTRPSGIIETTTGVYIDTLQTINGCDSIVTTNLTVTPAYNITVNTSICDNGAYTRPSGITETAAGTYFDTLQTSAGCDSIVTTVLTINPTYQVAENAEICTNKTYTLPSGVAINTSGTYIDTLHSVNGCDSVITTILIVNPIFEIEVRDTICAYQTYTLPKGNAVSTEGTYKDTLQSVNTCDSIITTILTVIDLNLSHTLTNVSCFGENNGSINVSSIGGVSPVQFIWNNSNYSGSALSSLSPGNYEVTATDAFGCTAANAMVITEPNELLATGAFTEPLCFDEASGTIAVQAQGGTAPHSYQLNNQNSNSGIFTGLTAGAYSITITDNNNCTQQTSVTITQPDELTINYQPNILEINLGDTIQLNLNSNYSNNVSYSWNPPTGLSCNDCPSPYISPNLNTNYVLTITASPHGKDCVYEFQFPIRVNIIETFFVPNVFTPNGDGNNDGFKVYFGSSPAVKKINIKIFNRWGEKVYESDDKNFMWDGTYKGENLKPDVFVYYLSLVFLDNTSQKNKGSITLLR